MHSRITRITCSRIKVTLKGIVCDGKTIDFETFEDTGSDLRRTVKEHDSASSINTNNDSSSDQLLLVIVRIRLPLVGPCSVEHRPRDIQFAPYCGPVENINA